VDELKNLKNRPVSEISKKSKKMRKTRILRISEKSIFHPGGGMCEYGDAARDRA
jgi:hypothetical protein